MSFKGTWKIHLFTLLITIAAEYIGIVKLNLGGGVTLVLLPLLYALVMGLVISTPKFRLLTEGQMSKAADFLNISIMILMMKLALGIGPNLKILMDASLALLVQEIGHFLGTIIFGLPVALIVGMRREAVGACYSVDREPNVAIIMEKYGINSPEGRGVMGMYICGTLFGAMWISLLSSLIAGTGAFHPYALAMGAGIGSASMMASATAPLIAQYPDFAEQIKALATAANVLTTVLGVYFGLFVSLPIMERSYTWAARVFLKDK